MLIYKLTNIINNKIYIGQFSSKNKCFTNYYGSGILIKRAIKNMAKKILKKKYLKNVKPENN